MIQEHHDDAQRMTDVMNVIAEHFRSMSPQAKDRLMQLHLAEARGPLRNARMLCDMSAMLLKARQINVPRGECDAQ